MAAGVLTGSGPLTYSFGRKFIPSPKPISKSNSFSFLAQKSNLNRTSYSYSRKQGKGIIIVVLNKKTEDHHAMQVSHDLNTIKLDESKSEAEIIVPRISNDRLARKKIERYTYLVAAVLSSLGVSSAAITAVYFRFSWQMQGGEFPVAEMLVTIFLVIGSAVGMEFWARWAHRALWHASLWHMHESHHRARDGPFEHNDVFAIINAVPAIALLYYGFFNTGLLPGLSFGAGLGITLFGMAYMFVHDGLVHRRFPVGPIANVPYLRKVAAAHQFHHSGKFGGVPYGLFLGPHELENVGGLEELNKEIQRIVRSSKSS
ncbi:beta-carotene hydroxylase 2, chloroplastic-like isoform X1 [Cannabis sativa]|uniref:beta-carotene hydroxylase 2, chloroplastic-like isoform X1 n=1 Tax=Cannabis sativa TaxID=3483 RepID=UPI0029CA67DE|nr:beta-carotene hydroxylase 2, chloroplastic-like isoform X1 [Cannabis sativa]